MPDAAQARAIAQDYIGRFADSDDSCVLVDEETVETGYGWVFTYQSKKYRDTGDYLYALAGNGPLVVMKRTGEIHQLPTAGGSWEDILTAFEQSHGLRR